MMEKLKYTKFKTLLISSFICISIIPVVLLGLFIFHLSKQELIRQSEKQMWQNSENVSDILDEKLDYIEEFSLKINVDTRIYKIFQNLDTSDSMQLESASQEISKILLDYLPWNNTVYSTHIVTPYYQFGEKEKNYYPNHSFMGSKIQKAADEANGKLVWIPAYNYMDMFSIEDMPRDFLEYEHVFTAVRKLQLSRVESGHIEHIENKTDQMYLVVNFTEDNLNNMLKKYTKANSQILYYIMSEDGSVVGPYGENESKLFRNVTAADMGITENKGTVKYYGANNQEYIVTYSKSMVTGWYTLAMIPVNVFSKNIATDLTRAILILVTIEIILSVTAAVLISRKIGKKVYKPLHMIEKTGEDNFTARIVYDDRDEFAFFYKKLNEMNQNLQMLVHEKYEMMIQKRDTEIMSLNIQMNPHFLYNSLNIINWVCLKGEQENASKMLLDLSRMLQYTSQNGDVLVPLWEDLDWLKRYIGIMQKRYQDQFEVSMDIPEYLRSLEVPKLFLQPFVENAIVHGFKNYQDSGKIWISAEEEENDILFYVEDNGCGICEEDLKEVLNKERKSIGVRNTNKRIRMIYGEKYGVTISSQLEEGTVVTIRLPLKINSKKQS